MHRRLRASCIRREEECREALKPELPLREPVHKFSRGNNSSSDNDVYNSSDIANSYNS